MRRMGLHIDFIRLHQLWGVLDQGEKFNAMRAGVNSAAKSDRITLAHWQLAQVSSIGILGSSSVRISCGLI
jgi:hypothetical protein